MTLYFYNIDNLYEVQVRPPPAPPRPAAPLDDLHFATYPDAAPMRKRLPPLAPALSRSRAPSLPRSLAPALPHSLAPSLLISPLDRPRPGSLPLTDSPPNHRRVQTADATYELSETSIVISVTAISYDLDWDTYSEEGVVTWKRQANYSFDATNEAIAEGTSIKQVNPVYLAAVGQKGGYESNIFYGYVS